MKTCKHCGFDTHIRNPSGYCDHLYYPENCSVCSKYEPTDKSETEITPLSGTGTCISELQSAINKLVDAVNALQDEVAEIKSEAGIRVGGGH